MILPSRSLLAWISLTLSLGLLGTGVFLVWKNNPRFRVAATRLPPPTAPASTGPGDTRSVVAGVGIVESAGRNVAVGSPLSGVVVAVPVEVGDRVTAGTPLIELDSRSARAAVAVSQAEVGAQRARLRELLAQVANRRARLASATASVRQAEAALAFAQHQLQRVESLRDKGAATGEEIEQRRLNRETEEVRVETARATQLEAQSDLRLLVGEGETTAPSVALAEALIAQAEAALRRDQVLLELHTICSPGPCQVLQIKIRPGEFLPANQLTTPAIVVGVTNPLHVRVEIDEADIPRFADDAPAYAQVRGRTDRQVPLKFVRREPLVTPKSSLAGGQRERIDTRVLEVIYSVTPEELQATVGQLVDVYVIPPGSTFPGSQPAPLEAAPSTAAPAEGAQAEPLPGRTRDSSGG